MNLDQPNPRLAGIVERATEMFHELPRPTAPDWVEGPLHEEWFIGARAAQEDWDRGKRGDTERDLGNRTRRLAYRRWTEWLLATHSN